MAENAMQWLWSELQRRYGDQVVAELKDQYLRRRRIDGQRSERRRRERYIASMRHRAHLTAFDQKRLNDHLRWIETHPDPDEIA